MAVVPLQAVPNQSLSFVVEAVRVDLRLVDLGNGMAADVSINGEVLLTGQRLVAGTPVIPYRYLERGNLVFVTLDGAAPNWPDFGLTQQLVYLSEAELGGA